MQIRAVRLCSALALSPAVIAFAGCGAPTSTCDAPGTVCGTQCVNLQDDPTNCGACDTVCAAGNTCSNGTCCQDPSLTGCNGACTDVNTDAANCGTCGNACVVPNAVPDCNGGICGIARCNPGFADCNAQPADGCEQDVSGSLTNCGTCGNVCTNVVANGVRGCVMGSCGIGTCNKGFGDCNNKASDGCESNLNADINNCGTCGNACTANQVCCNGSCHDQPAGGPLQNLPISSLTAACWSQCFVETYNQSQPTIAAIQASCPKAKLLVACRTSGNATLQLAGWAPRADVFFDTGTGDTPHNANGLGWYFNNNYSWGFANQGDALQRQSCDISSLNGQFRLCWHTNSGSLSGGFRCGNDQFLNSSTTFERIIFQSN